MARTNLAVQNLDMTASVLPADLAADVANGNMFDGGSNVILEVFNSGASPYTVTLQTPATASGLAVADVGPISVAAGARRLFGPFPANLWAQPSGTDSGKVYVDATNAAMKLSPIRVP